MGNINLRCARKKKPIVSEFQMANSLSRLLHLTQRFCISLKGKLVTELKINSNFGIFEIREP